MASLKRNTKPLRLFP